MKVLKILNLFRRKETIFLEHSQLDMENFRPEGLKHEILPQFFFDKKRSLMT